MKRVSERMFYLTKDLKYKPMRCASSCLLAQSRVSPVVVFETGSCKACRKTKTALDKPRKREKN